MTRKGQNRGPTIRAWRLALSICEMRMVGPINTSLGYMNRLSSYSLMCFSFRNNVRNVILGLDQKDTNSIVQQALEPCYMNCVNSSASPIHEDRLCRKREHRNLKLQVYLQLYLQVYICPSKGCLELISWLNKGCRTLLTLMD